jgi:hypothetical protein
MYYLPKHINFNQVRVSTAGILLCSALLLSQVQITLTGIPEEQILKIAIILGSEYGLDRTLNKR